MDIFKRLFGRGNKGGSGDTYTEPRSGLTFPLELGGLRRLASGRPYAEGNRTGESIPYGLADAQATIYVTTVGQAEFPDGGDSDFIRGELESAISAVRAMQRQGHYQSVKFFTGQPERLGTDPGNLLWVRGGFMAMTPARPMISFTYITALRGRVIKLRLSAPDPNNKAFQTFPPALGDLISRQR